jgi:hypothetical protein
MNIGLIILIIIIILIFLLTIGLLLYNNNITTVIGTSTGILNSNHCTPPISSLPDLSFGLCCNNFGALTNNKFYSPLNLTVSPNPVPFLQACSSFCTQGYDPNLKDCAGNINSDTQQFNNCLKAADPAGRCGDKSFPIAVSNGTYLYASSAGTTLCSSQSQCTLVL